jgi:hypothetical protein
MMLSQLDVAARQQHCLWLPSQRSIVPLLLLLLLPDVDGCAEAQTSA